MATQNVTITINTPADVTPAQVVDALSAYWGYQAVVDGQPNPETKNVFVKRRIAEFVKESYRAAKARETDQARVDALVDADRVGVS